MPSFTRLPTRIPELDAVLGGGISPGSTITLTGPQGVGKMSFLLRAAKALADAGHGVLIATNEQPASVMRHFTKRNIEHTVAARLRYGSSSVMPTTGNMEAHRIAEIAGRIGSKLVIVDSLQDVAVNGDTSMLGSQQKVGAVANYLSSFAQQNRVAVALVRHSRRGRATGPALVDHLADVQLDMDWVQMAGKQIRMLLVAKNRFGHTGTSQVLNP